MTNDKILQELKDRVFVIDGAMGTMLQKYGFTKGCPDELNISNPEIVKKVHKAYADAGADLVITNTFGAHRLKLEKYGLQDKIKEINKAAVKNAREACPNCFVVGDVGPLGEFIEPLGKLSFDNAYSVYKEQISALADADLLIIETISDIKELKAALIAAKEVFSGPVISSMTIQDGRTTTGTDVETYVVIADTLGADIIGVNCSDGPEGMYETAKIIVKNTNKPIMLEPNAGLPKLVGKETVWDYHISRFADYAEKFVKLGANIVGGCCGTNPDFIKEICSRVKKLKPVKREIKLETKLCSRTKTLTVRPTLIVGERINPTNRKNFISEIKEGKTDYIRNQAVQQAEEGASLLDINVGVAGGDETKILPKAIEDAQNVVNIPLVIDTSNAAALEEALKRCDGKCLINSVHGSEKSLQSVLPLAKKYGAAIIALCLDESGIPKTVEKRIEIAKKIIDRALKIGIKKEDIIVDSLVLTIATNPENEKIILEAVNEIKKLGYKTILGVSNISHGLPNRREINSKFFTKAHQVGLDLAILNPLDNILQEETDISIDVKKAKKEDYKNLSSEKKLYHAILLGDKDNIVSIIDSALKELKAMKINDILIDALHEVGKKFNCKEYFLPNVLLSAEAMKKAFSRLKKALILEGGKEKGTVLFATVENDIHDIGKNIVIALLESHNYNVIDLGANVKTKKIIEEVVDKKPDIVALSALMTTTVMEMENVIKELRLKNINVPVIVGGAVVTDDYASQIKAAYGKDALSAVKIINELIKRKNKKIS
ncbi:MAG: homocysteine S-methyltransferase family protein [Nanoarchaeota archaeon]|nr:homocysteine S-methyltransferase family protein [Nanoarchaeota archaeon]MBU1004326.1 homocysteine S-methyltransferase family protein [Nanoarchaeota archaeon]MBU1945456.1 homocysteine S-methyltransferase family protein [Nanoarchaeota archaeon]